MRELHQDPLKVVTIPGTDTSIEESSIGKATGVAFNGADINSDKFVVTNQLAQVDGRTVMVGGSARFIFATDSGRLAAWGERGPDGKVVRVNGPSQEVFNGDPEGMKFFGRPSSRAVSTRSGRPISVTIRRSASSTGTGSWYLPRVSPTRSPPATPSTRPTRPRARRPRQVIRLRGMSPLSVTACW
jgi:hypothetical protein